MSHHHTHDHGTLPAFLIILPALLLGLLLLADAGFVISRPAGVWRPVLYALVLAPLAVPVMAGAWRELRGGEVFNEFLLMLLAAAGAFGLGEYPEAVAVLLFYAVGEALQHRAVERARRDVRALAALRPGAVNVETPEGLCGNAAPRRWCRAR